jgi:hypothetical protein
MNLLLVACVWALVTLDCTLMGYRLAMGRSAALDKRRYHLVASLRAGLAGQLPFICVLAIAVVLADRGGPSVTVAFNDAMGRFIIVGGSYAALMLGAWAFCILRSVTVATIASVLVFGPFTLLRPAVVVLTIGIAVGPSPPAALLVVGLLIAIPGIALEPLLDRRIAKQLLTP